MTYERLAPQAFKHADGSVVRIVSELQIEYAEPGRQRVAYLGYALPSSRRLRIFTRDLRSWTLLGTALRQEPMSDADRTRVLDRIANGYRFLGYEVDLVQP